VNDLQQTPHHESAYAFGAIGSKGQISTTAPPDLGLETQHRPGGRESRDGSLVRQALERLRSDPSISRGVLAEGLGVSPSKLGKAFRAQVGVAFVDYRNQLRLERFLKLVFPGGGNVSAAARSAGFGSYAQFHRVFRSLVGKSPKEYLRQGPSEAPQQLA
jgi:AraC-like DNA-binding protein